MSDLISSPELFFNKIRNTIGYFYDYIFTNEVYDK